MGHPMSQNALSFPHNANTDQNIWYKQNNHTFGLIPSYLPQRYRCGNVQKKI